MNTIPHPDENRKPAREAPKPLPPPAKPPPPKGPYISELKLQLDVVKQKISELEDKAAGGILDSRFRKQDRDEAARLIARRKQLEERIMFYEP